MHNNIISERLRASFMTKNIDGTGAWTTVHAEATAGPHIIVFAGADCYYLL